MTEAAEPGRDGERYSVTPDLGVFRATTGANGDLLVGEDRLRALLATAHRPRSWRSARPRCSAAPGTTSSSRSAEAGEGATVTWLHQVV